MRILVLSDMGQQNYHVGDEAMGIVAADEMIARGHEVIFLTRSVDHTRQHIGTGVDYLPTLQFPCPPAERETQLHEFTRFLEGERGFIAPEKEAEFAGFLNSLETVDAVLIAGGGNLNSVYGWLLYERAALVAAAHRLGKPVVVSGQSVGPVLTENDAHVLGRLLNTADLVSMREPSSQNWCRNRGVLSVATLDDATFYQPQNRTLPGETELFLPEKFISVTFNNLNRDQSQAAARLLDRISADFELTPVFVPHQGNPDLADGDVTLHQQIAGFMQSRSVVLPVVHADTAVRVHRAAELVLTTRYHPAVLALGYGVPSLGLIPDAYTEVRLAGALGHFGMENYAISLSLLTSEESPDLVYQACAELVEKRAELSESLRQRGQELEVFESQWWDAVAQTLTGAEAELPVLKPAETVIRSGAEHELNVAVRQAISEWSLRALNAEAALDRALSWSQRP